MIKEVVFRTGLLGIAIGAFVCVVGNLEVGTRSGPAPIRLGMLVGRMNPLAVRVHVGDEERRIKT